MAKLKPRPCDRQKPGLFCRLKRFGARVHARGRTHDQAAVLRIVRGGDDEQTLRVCGETPDPLQEDALELPGQRQ